MADIFIVRGQLKLSLWFVGVGFFMGLLATWHAWGQIGLGGEGREQFLLSATVTGALAVAWIVLLVLCFFVGRLMEPDISTQRRERSVPWWVLKCAVLLVFIAALALLLPWLSSQGGNEFALLRKGKFSVLEERLIENPELLESKEKGSGKTLLALALGSGNPEAVELLLSNGAELASMTNGQNWVVAALPNLPLLESLLRHGADPDVPDVDGLAPVHHATETQNTNALTVLLDAGANADALDKLYQTPLLLAIMADDLPMAETLIKYGADPNQRDRRGDTILHKAVRRRKVESVRFLIEKGADPKVFNFKSMAPIHIAALNGQDELVELFLEQPGMVDLRGDDDRTAFDHALRRNKYETAQLLIKHGADIDRIMSNGYTAIHLMVIAREYKTVEFLIEEGADVHIADPDGETAHYLMRKKQLQHLLDLIEARDNPSEEPSPTNAVDVEEEL